MAAQSRGSVNVLLPALGARVGERPAFAVLVRLELHTHQGHAVS